MGGVDERLPSGGTSDSVANAYEIAKSGGTHSGIITRYAGEPDRFVERALRSVERRIAEHCEKISEPRRFVKRDATDLQVSYLVNDYWPKEIRNFEAEAEVLRGILQERKRGK